MAPNTTKDGDKTRLEDGKLLVFKRGGKYHARIYVGNNKYKTQTLKTGNRGVAIKAATKLFHQVEAKLDMGLAISPKRAVDVLDEYVAYRTKQHTQGHTQAGMLRQIVRVTKFWREYVGKRLITSIDNAAMSDFVVWRRDYYARLAPTQVPKNAKLHPKDKEVHFNVTFMRGVLRWAHDKGYMGMLPLPTYSFIAKNKRARPAFELPEYRLLWRALLKWERQCTDARYLHTRQLLRDYVLILANTGMRVGEANNLKVRDIQPFIDGLGRHTYRFIVRGKTGERDVIPRIGTGKYIERLMGRKTKPKPDDWFFAMQSGSKVITLIDQFDKVLKLAGIEHNSAGDKYSLYSLRHFYAVMALRKGITDYAVAANMGTSTQMLKQYYGKQATPASMAVTLGGMPRNKRDDKRDKPNAKQSAKLDESAA